MSNKQYWPALLLGVTLLAGSCLAQTPEPSKFYKLDFVVKEVEANKVLNSRAYSMTVSTEKTSPPDSIRAGSKVPSGNGSNYIEVGVNIDCRAIREVDNELTMLLTVEVSSVPPESSNPVIRQNKWSSSVSVMVKKPTVVFSSDDLTSKHQLQLELTATPIK